ncbi:hypothetical protein ES332_A11G261800v1 [Gossypium tomentosum]|uniref:Peroxidase n=1 Tax=Gossypium tomentosum TaxID=34277 RepID=A0A5D2NG45_GOSTO|nr:hypothetical protein ES332_A11G261800v1 [Gossypium tomentosum]
MRLKVTFVLFLLILPLALANLRVGFYRRSCPNAESIVRAAVRRRLSRDKSITAALLRMHFHDCFVRLIDEAKKALEATCPSKVSCADIITLATRDAVFLSGGPFYFVPTGRRDSLVSDPDEVNLPGPILTVSEAFQAFRAKNMSMDDMVTLLGAHTVGVAHCSFFLDRITRPDPTMDRGLAAKLRSICGAASGTNPDPTAFLDQATPFAVDNQFFKQIGLKRGVMKIDQELANDPLSRRIVSGFAANATLFRTRFAQAMVKMGNIQVLVREIRKNCRVFNPRRRI